MLTPVITATGLVTGDRMDVGEFLRRWEELPELKKAELIDGSVYVPSPVTLEHARRDKRILWWLTQYSDATPGCECGENGTWLMLDSAPQPDAFLRILPSHGGQSRDVDQYCAGAPELAVEICATSTEVDFGPKLRLYQRAGVREYITVETLVKRIVWRLLDQGAYFIQGIPADGILRSRVFPGLWLDVAGFWVDDGANMLATLNAGLTSDDHQRFVQSLAGKARV